MKKVLLDTQILIYCYEEPEKIPRYMQTVLESSGNEIFVSAASTWEIAIKARLGKINNAEELLDNFNDIISQMGMIQLPISSGDAILAGKLEWGHNDVFDRMLIAQAVKYHYTLASIDTIICKAFPQYVLKKHF